jgi:glycosyltransferase involved in cell wall biosynthesis
MEATGAKRKLLNFVEKLTYACATMVYPNSKGLYEYIVKNKYTSIDKLKVIANGSSNGIDTEHFSPDQVAEIQKTGLKNQLDTKDSDFVFIFVGRLVGDKGINELVAAFSQLNKEVKDIKLLLVGPQEEELDALLPETIKEINNNPTIIEAGFQSDVRPYFAISDVLVFPSYREGFPNVVMQAGAMGLPSIVSDINGCNEIIVEGKNGNIIAVKDKEAIFRAMNKMLMANEYRTRLQANAREMIVSRFEQKLVWDAILDEYRNLENNV